MKYYKFKGGILLLLAAMISACNNESNFFLEEGQPVTRSAIYSNENDSTEYETRVVICGIYLMIIVGIRNHLSIIFSIIPRK